MAAYRQITYRLPASREDEFAAWLADRGSMGCSVLADPSDASFVRLTAYFAEDSRAPADLVGWEAEEETSGQLQDADWLAAYRAASAPFDLGRSFRIDPREPDDVADGAADAADAAEEDSTVRAAGDDRKLLRIPARTAFGTGSHESTRLCVLWLEDLARRDGFARWRTLDVGTGSGILALCAEALGARPAAGYDLDAAAVLVARDNARRNDCRPVLWAGTLGSLAPDARFDLALVNVLPERILGVYPDLVARLAAGALVVSSGNLVERRDEMLGRFAEMGLELVGEKAEGEWVSFLLRKVGPDSGGVAPPGRETTGLSIGSPSEGAPRHDSR